MEYTVNGNDDPAKEKPSAAGKTVILAGATGDLGQRIAAHLLKSGAQVKALVRKGSANQTLALLQNKGIQLSEVDFNSQPELAKACAGGSCVVSALNGLEDVIVDVQSNLLHAAVSAGVPRFIPSDYCIDYTKLSHGSNRNLDLRRRFSERLNEAPVAATSILNGMFTNLLTGEAPIVLFGLKRVVYWGDAEQLLDFTTIENTAEYTAHAALDDSTPRYLRIAGDVVSAKGLRDAATAATGDSFRLLRGGGMGRLHTMIKITRTLMPNNKEIFPAWQGMQYMHNMYTGLPKLSPLDNDRYPGMRWTSVQEILQKRENKKQ